MRSRLGGAAPLLLCLWFHCPKFSNCYVLCKWGLRSYLSVLDSELTQCHSKPLICPDSFVADMAPTLNICSIEFMPFAAAVGEVWLSKAGWRSSSCWFSMYEQFSMNIKEFISLILTRHRSLGPWSYPPSGHIEGLGRLSSSIRTRWIDFWPRNTVAQMKLVCFIGAFRGYSRSRYELGNKCVIMTHFCCEIIYYCCCLIDNGKLQLNHWLIHLRNSYNVRLWRLRLFSSCVYYWGWVSNKILYI